ncbi:LamG domain-containing protein [Luteolibacter pohnpeiensis]|uniref:LamG domain-containing protein n=1 Tax=Luteolibacter pohnpeiensis TaxID=454153 RepID=A0A934S1E1_9BACT|nr:LamG domain-containing protein [Luteolibacter pohnpeiensis]MBK1881455.1 LamG domain-containing protein [Luteolibacter pohnpeiensis]
MKSIAIGVAAAALLALPSHAAVYAHYSFDTDYTDDSGNGRDATLVDTGTIGDSGITTTAGDYVFGGGAMNFSAERDYLDVAMATFSSGSAYTISFWAQKTEGDTGGAADWDMVIGDRGNTNFFIGLNDTTGAGFRWRSSSSAAERQAEFTVAKDYDWHLYTLVASGTTITLYVDGVLVGSDSGNSTGFQYNTIGEAYPSTNDFDFHGQIDELWVFDEALDETAVSNLYNYNSVIPEPSCLLLGAAGLVLTARRRR